MYCFQLYTTDDTNTLLEMWTYLKYVYYTSSLIKYSFYFINNKKR